MGKGVGLWTEIERDECEPPSTPFPMGITPPTARQQSISAAVMCPGEDLQLPYGPNQVSPLSCSQTIKADRN